MPCTISGKGIAPSYFSDHHNFGTERDSTNEHKMNFIDIFSTYQPNTMLFCRISVFKLERFETYEREQYFCH